MTFPAEILSHTPAKMRFELVSETDRVICDSEPLEWKSGTLELKRDLESGGVFTSYQQDSLTFIGNGGVFLRNLYDSYELTPRAKCTLIISYWKEFDLTTPANSRQYVEFPSRFEINFNFYETVKIGRFWFGVRVKAINSSVQTKLDNRMDVDVDITKLVSIGGVTVNEFSNLDQLKLINYDATNVNYRAELSKDQTGSGVLIDRSTNGTPTYTSIPLVITAISAGVLSEFTEVQSVGYQTRISDIKYITAFFKDALFDYPSLDITYQSFFRVTNKHSASFNYEVFIIETDINGLNVTETSLGEFGKFVRLESVYGTANVKCDKGNSLKFVVVNGGITDTTAYIDSALLKITQTVSQSPAATVEGFPIYEAMQRLCQLILDTQYPIYSDFFGRTDVEYRPGVYYSAENVDQFAHVQGGMNLRGVKLDNLVDPVPLTLSFKKLFGTKKALWNAGYSLEINPTLFGDPYPRIRIEEYAHFFDSINELVFDPPIKDRINKYDIQSVVMPELVPVDLKSGFENFEYLSMNGRAEPNTTNQRTSAMNTASKWENISPYRADTKGILDNLSNPIDTNGSTDTKGDNSIFITKTRKHPTITNRWIPETNELITIDNDSSLFKDALMNRYFTPTRMLIRHANRIKAGLTKLATTDVLRFQSSDKNCSLETSGDGLDLLFENSDIPMSTLANPIYKAMKHTATMIFTRADLALLIANPYKFLDFGLPLKGNTNITGFLLNLKQKNLSDKAEITIIERYVPPS